MASFEEIRIDFPDQKGHDWGKISHFQTPNDDIELCPMKSILYIYIYGTYYIYIWYIYIWHIYIYGIYIYIYMVYIYIYGIYIHIYIWYRVLDNIWGG